MFFYTTEVTSSKIHSDSPIYQRTKKAYEIVAKMIHGSVLEIGPGEGYGINIIKESCQEIYAIDKNPYSIKQLLKKFPDVIALQGNVPPLNKIEDNSMDFVISFQVIEHIKNDKEFISEIHRVLKPGGTAFLTTPNIEHSIARNPWHYREYTHQELKFLLQNSFNNVKVMGISGNDLTKKYYDKNRKRVENILKWDVLRLEKRLPAFLLQLPYEVLNRINRKNLLANNQDLVSEISSNDYSLQEEYTHEVLDFFCAVTK